MNVRTRRSLLFAAAVVIMLNFNSCGKYDDGPSFSLKSKTARLTGEWEIITVDGDIDLGDEEIILEFEKEGDFKITNDYGSYSYSYEGEWAWEDKKETIEITMDGNQTEWEVKRLTNSEFWFEDEDRNLFECEKK